MKTKEGKVYVQTYLTLGEYSWLEAIIQMYGLSTAAALRMLVHEGAEKRGLKQSQMPLDIKD